MAKDMRNRSVQIFFLSIALLGILQQIAFSQSVSQFELALKKYFETIDTFVHQDSDSLRIANRNLSDYLKRTLPKIPELLIITPKLPVDHTYSDRNGNWIPKMWLATSADTNIRIWTWDTWLGGSMPALTNIIEFRTKNGIQVIDLEEDRGWGPQDRGWNHVFDTIFITH